MDGMRRQSSRTPTRPFFPEIPKRSEAGPEAIDSCPFLAASSHPSSLSVPPGETGEGPSIPLSTLANTPS